MKKKRYVKLDDTSYFKDFDILISYDVSEHNRNPSGLRQKLFDFLEQAGGKDVLESVFLFKDTNFDTLKAAVERFIDNNFSTGDKVDIIFSKITQCDNTIWKE